jgi:hypothetical protein
MLQVYIFIDVYSTLLQTCVLSLAIQASSFKRVHLWRFHFSHVTQRQRQIQHLQLSVF